MAEFNAALLSEHIRINFIRKDSSLEEWGVYFSGENIIVVQVEDWRL